VKTYRARADEWLPTARQPGAAFRYQDQVHPALRLATTACGRIREMSYRPLQQVGQRSREVGQQALHVVAVVALGALAALVLLAVSLSRGVIAPMRDLADSVEAIRRGDFQQRVQVEGSSEVRRLAERFNRMAESLDEYRSTSLGQILRVKTTLEATLGSLPAAVIVLDPDGLVAAANPLARALLNASDCPDARRLTDLPLSPRDLETVCKALQGKPADDGPADLARALSVELQGRPVKMLLGTAPIPEFLPGRSGAVLVYSDVTDFARLDELRSELVAVASHELKTPLTTLRMTLHLLGERAENLSPRQHEILSAALLGGEELAGTIDELLDLTRIEAGQFRLMRERADLYALIGQAVAGLRLRYEDGGIDLRVDRQAASAVVRGDAARLRIVVANLLTNALKYTPRGGTVAIEVTGDRRLTVAVTDSGPGIPADFHERVFEKFFRIEHQRPWGSDGVRGAGIGLYLCRQIIEAHGGRITCGAGPAGRGTRIAFELDAIDSENGARHAEGGMWHAETRTVAGG